MALTSPSSNMAIIPTSSKRNVSLPIDVLRLIFSFLDSEIDLLVCSRVCKAWETAANTDFLWQNLIIQRKISSWFSSSTIEDEAKGSIVGCNWKSLFKNYYLACKTGHNILAGPYGKVHSCTLSYSSQTVSLVEIGKSESIPLAFKKKRYGGGCVLLLLPRFDRKRQGQMLIFSAQLNFTSHSKKFSSTEKLLLNIFSDSATKTFTKVNT